MGECIMNKIKVKKISKMLAVVMIAFCILSIPKAVYAAQSAYVRYQWDEIHQESYKDLHYDTNEYYKTIKFVHGYKTSERTKDITSFWDNVGKIYSRIRHTVTFTTY